MDLCLFAEDQITHYAREIVAGGPKLDEHAVGEMLFYIAMRRALMSQRPQDLSLMDAVIAARRTV
jgi:hypothetical protein